MEPPRKRPRLHQIVGSATPEPDDELACAREKNDKLLKTRWEAIFRKYEHDFSTVGDEIGVLSGQIEVDNGHIRSMQDDRDTGKTFRAMSVFDGRRMLRAMTVASSDSETSLPDADDVLQSIETIAGNAQLLEISSDDDLFDANQEESDNDEDELSKGYYVSPAPRVKREPTVAKSNSRGSSVDSLFAGPNMRKPPRDTSSATLEYAELQSPASNMPQQHLSTPIIRQTVRQMLEEERVHERAQAESKVDPAWRIPVRVPSPVFRTLGEGTGSRGSSRHSSISQIDERMDDALPPDFDLWAPRQRGRKRQREVTVEKTTSITAETTTEMKTPRRIRDQSEDPLQEGFSDEIEIEDGEFGGLGKTFSVMREPRRSKSHDHRQSSINTNDTGLEVRKRRRTSSRDRQKRKSPDAEDSDDSDVYLPQPSDDEQAILDDAQEEIASEDELSEGMTPQPPATRSVEPQSQPKPPKIRVRASQIEVVRHPWDSPTTRAGGPINQLALSIRKTVAGKFARPFTHIESEDNKDEIQAQILATDSELAKLRSKRGKEVLSVMEKAQCFYCKLKYTAKHAVGSHWDRILTTETLGALSKEDPHNIDFLKEVRSTVARKNRAPTTLVLDFCKMVELIEGSKLSFEEIADLKCLICRKAAKQLKIEYDLYRHPDAETAFVWQENSEERLDHLLDVADNKLTMFQMHRLLGAFPMMTFVDIGNKMAEKVLERYNANPTSIMEQIREARKAKADRDADRVRDSADDRSTSRSFSQAPTSTAGPRTWKTDTSGGYPYPSPFPGQHVAYSAPDGNYPHAVWDEGRQGFWVAQPASQPFPQQTPQSRFSNMAPEMHRQYGTPDPYHNMYDYRIAGCTPFADEAQYPRQGIVPLSHGTKSVPNPPRQGVMPLGPD